ncbi:hypothetical protein, partial [Dyella humi]
MDLAKIESMRRELLLRRLQRNATPLVPERKPAIVHADRDQPLRLSWSQQRLWFLDQLDRAASVAYHL